MPERQRRERVVAWFPFREVRTASLPGVAIPLAAALKTASVRCCRTFVPYVPFGGIPLPTEGGNLRVTGQRPGPRSTGVPSLRPAPWSPAATAPGDRCPVRPVAAGVRIASGSSPLHPTPRASWPPGRRCTRRSRPVRSGIARCRAGAAAPRGRVRSERDPGLRRRGRTARRPRWQSPGSPFPGIRGRRSGRMAAFFSGEPSSFLHPTSRSVPKRGLTAPRNSAGTAMEIRERYGYEPQHQTSHRRRRDPRSHRSRLRRRR